MKLFNYVLPFIACLLLFSSCDPEMLNIDQSGVFGVVRDLETGSPVPGAQVFLNGPESQTGVSDQNGNYRFENLPAGSYVLSAQQDRYITPYVDVDLSLSAFSQVDVLMEYESMLSTHVLDFSTNADELEIVVTNLLDQPIDIDTEEDEIWLTANHFISGLEPGESEIITVKVNRIMMQNDNYSVPLIVNVEEDFGFDVLESYVVNIQANR